MPSPVTITPAQADEFLKALQANLTTADLGDVVVTTNLKPRDLKSLVDVLRETTIAFEDGRRAAGRKEKQ